MAIVYTTRQKLQLVYTGAIPRIYYFLIAFFTALSGAAVLLFPAPSEAPIQNTQTVSPALEEVLIEVEKECNATARISSEVLEQGDTFVFSVEHQAGEVVPRAWFDGEPVLLVVYADKAVGIVGIHTKDAPGTRTLVVESADGRRLSQAITVARRNFPVTKIIVPPKLVEEGVTPAVLAQNIAETDKPTLDKALSVAPTPYPLPQPFGAPLAAWTDVGAFGNIRQGDDGSAIQHLGVDLAGDAGEPVFSANDGVVTFADALPSFGNSVIIHHGQGISTLYLHLTDIDVVLGKEVTHGQKIGTVGSTGEYSLEPHLHFSVKIRGASVDPKRFLDATTGYCK